MEMKLKYTEKKTLQCRDAISPIADEDIEGILLIGDKEITVQGHGNRFGRDAKTIVPAIHNGKRVWLTRCIWQPASGYSAFGTAEVVIPFETGVKMLIENGYFSFPEEEPEQKDEIVRDGIAHHRHGEYDYYHPIERMHKEE